MMKLILAFLSILPLMACNVMLAPNASSPEEKLKQAQQLFLKHNRPVAAESQIREAIDILKQENNDTMLLAHAYSVYGLFFAADAIEGKWSKHYIATGFQDKSATFANRFTKSIEYYERALPIFEKFNAQGDLLNARLNMGVAYAKMKEHSNACKMYDLSMQHYKEAIRQNPNAKLGLYPGETYASFLAPFRRDSNCT